MKRKSLSICIGVLIIGLSIFPLVGSMQKSDELNEEYISSISIKEESKPPLRIELGDWWDTSWAYSKKIIIDHNQVAGTLQDFPVLIYNISNDFTIHAQFDGDDFIFVNEINTTQLYHEIESYDSLTGELITWVNIPTLSSTEDTNFYMYYGNPSCESQENIAATWDEHYIGVWHMNDWNSTIIADSSGNDHFGMKKDIDQPIEVPSWINSGQDFERDTRDWIKVPDDPDFYVDDELTVEAWFNLESHSSTESRGIVNKHKVNYNYDDFKLVIAKTTATHAKKLIFVVYEPDAGETLNIYINGTLENTSVDDAARSTTVVTPNTWYYVVGSVSGCSGLGNTTHPVGIGYHEVEGSTPKREFDGVIDEVRISDIVRSSEWVSTSYQNQYDPTSFVSIGDEVSGVPQLDITYVDDDFNASTPGWQVTHFDSIQDGINAVLDQGTVIVYDGFYAENIGVSKPLTLIGEDRDHVIVDGGGNGDVVHITAAEVTMSGFTVQNSGGYWSHYDPDAGIEVRADTVEISDNILIGNNRYGVYVRDSAYVNVANNYIHNNYDDGIYLHYSHLNSVSDNLVYANLDNAISVKESTNNYVVNNTASGHTDSAFVISDSASYNVITKNNIIDNGRGLNVRSSHNTFFHNNIINNNESAYDSSTNTWYNTTLEEGNYWSDYTGIDSDYDGIGDTPYDIPGGSNQDLYPFMNPSGWINEPPELPSEPQGPTHGRKGTTYIFTTDTTDPNGDLLWYNWSWGDGSYSGWLGPYGSGLIAGAAHAWTSHNTFHIKVKARDIYGAESGWSDTHIIRIIQRVVGPIEPPIQP